MPKTLHPSPRYFATFKSYRIPLVPKDEIEEAEAKQRTSYYIAQYDAQGQLIALEKRLNGELEFRDEYEYWDGTSKLKLRRMIDPDGSVEEHRYDRRGRKLGE